MCHFHPAAQFCAKVIHNAPLKGEYWILRCEVPEGFAAAARPGQFVHVRIPGIEAHLLRRPFSICDCCDGELTIVYKVVGIGSAALSRVRSGNKLDVLGPLGHGFTIPDPGSTAQTVMLGGGYGCAAMFFYAHWLASGGNGHQAPSPLILLGARSANDILLMDDFRALGCQVLASTDDGSMGTKGRITALMQQLAEDPDGRHRRRRLAACGPMPMLRAVAAMAAGNPDWRDCEVSLDEIMCCGVGACFGCVVKCRSQHAPEDWEYRRSCLEGPVFKAEEIYWE